ncbi:MAG TPA: hypothetical protein VGD43_20200 [Micromonospora sp.]
MNSLATGLTALALLTAAVVLATAGSWRAALGVLLEMLAAAGLIRLSAAHSWTAIGGAAVIVTVRLLLFAVLRAPIAVPGQPRSPGRGPGLPASPGDSRIR